MNTKKIPLRKCVATNEMLPKKDLIRVCKDNQNNVFIDKTSKANGRGAYLKPSEEAILLAKKTKVLERTLQTNIDENIYEELLKLVKKN